MHLRKLQTVFGLGRPRQSATQSGAADGTDGIDLVHSDRGLVSPDRACARAFSRSSMVSAEGRTLLRGHVDDAAAGQLRRKNRTSADKTESHQNLVHPAYRAFYARRMSSASVGNTHGIPGATTQKIGGNYSVRPLEIRAQICET